MKIAIKRINEIIKEEKKKGNYSFNLRLEIRDIKINRIIYETVWDGEDWK